jgi:hypothetical protein
MMLPNRPAWPSRRAGLRVKKWLVAATLNSACHKRLCGAKVINVVYVNLFFMGI